MTSCVHAAAVADLTDKLLADQLRAVGGETGYQDAFERARTVSYVQALCAEAADRIMARTINAEPVPEGSRRRLWTLNEGQRASVTRWAETAMLTWQHSASVSEDVDRITHQLCRRLGFLPEQLQRGELGWVKAQVADAIATKVAGERRG